MRKLIIYAAICALLCGCAQTSASATATITASTLPGSGTSAPAAGTVLENLGSDALGVYSLPVDNVSGIRCLGDTLVLFSGSETTTLTFVSTGDMAVLTTVPLEFYLAPEEPTEANETLRFYDRPNGKIWVVDSTGTVTKTVAAPADLVGKPILSADGNTLYYCTSTALRAWDLDSGTRRAVKEMAYEEQSVTALLEGDGIILCSVTNGGSASTLLLSAEDGHLLDTQPSDLEVQEIGGTYYARFGIGAVQALVYGSEGSQRLLLPEDDSGENQFLIAAEGALSLCSAGSSSYTLTYYDLTSGGKGASITLSSDLAPTVAEGPDSSVFLLIHSPDTQKQALLRWYPLAEASEFTGSYASSYCGEEDAQALEACRSYASELGKKYGIEVLVGQDAAAEGPWDYELTPETIPAIVMRELERLDKLLAEYPQELLEQTKAHFSAFRICIVRQLQGTAGEDSLDTAAGLQYFREDRAYLALATGRYAERTLYHEMYHAMSTHLLANTAAFDRWDELNPTGFKYDYDYAANASRNSGIFLQEGNRYFIDTYSMSYPKEDQARIMEYAMLPGNEALFQEAALQKKLKTLCQGIREAYGLEASEESFLWEQYLN